MSKNKQLFEEYITQNLEHAYRFAFSYVRNHQDAEDIVSQSVMKALLNVHKLKDGSYMKTWFFRIIINTANTYLKKKKRFVFMEYQDISAEQVQSGDYEYLDLKEQISHLSSPYREIIILRFFEDFSLKEISETLDENLNTVKTRLYKALRTLKLEMEDSEL